MTRVPAYVSPPTIYNIIRSPSHIRFFGASTYQFKIKINCFDTCFAWALCLVVRLFFLPMNFVVACRGARNALVCYRFLSFNLDF